MTERDKLKCFVLMPFGDDFDPVYERLIKSPLEDLGFDVSRADSLFNQRNILQDIVEGIAAADYIVADLTGLNPNVFYELGMAHALGKRTVIITQELSTLPFDLRTYRANGYSTLFTEAEGLSALIVDVARGVLDETAEFSNPVQDYAPDALATWAQVSNDHRAVVVREEGGDPADGDEDGGSPGFLEAAVALEHTSQEVIAAADTLGELTAGIGSRFDVHTHRLERAQRNLGSRSAGAFLAIARDAAKDLDAFNEEMSDPVTRLQDGLKRSTDAANTLAKEAQIHTEADIEGALRLMHSMEVAEEGMLGAWEHVTGFAGTMAGMPNVDHKLTASARRTNSVLMRAADAIETGAAEFSRARGVIESRVDAASS